MFRGSQALARPKTDIRIAPKHSAYERGSNENANKLIRRFIPKGADIKDYAKDEPKTMRWMNNYLRKILGGKTPLTAEEELAKQGVITFSKGRHFKLHFAIANKKQTLSAVKKPPHFQRRLIANKWCHLLFFGSALLSSIVCRLGFAYNAFAFDYVAAFAVRGYYSIKSLVKLLFLWSL